MRTLILLATVALVSASAAYLGTRLAGVPEAAIQHEVDVLFESFEGLLEREPWRLRGSYVPTDEIAI